MEDARWFVFSSSWPVISLLRPSVFVVKIYGGVVTSLTRRSVFREAGATVHRLPGGGFEGYRGGFATVRTRNLKRFFLTHITSPRFAVYQFYMIVKLQGQSNTSIVFALANSFDSKLTG